MASGGGGEGLVGKKRKSADDDMLPARREPRRGLGVAALESIRAQLETVENFYVFPALSTPTPTPPPPISLPASMLVPGVRFNPYVGNGALQRDYCYPQYYGPQHYGLPSRYLQQLQATNGHALPRHQNHQAAAQSDIGAMAAGAPLLEEKDHRRQAQAHGQTKRPPPAAFVDLVDSDDDDHSAQEELDLELRL